MKYNRKAFIFADGPEQLSSKRSIILYYLWNTLALVLSSAALCAVSLNFAIGDMPFFYIYLGYFKVPEIFLFNWLPVLLLQVLLYALTGRQWAAFLINSVFTLVISLGNYFKLKFRSDPFTFEDISSIRAGLTVAKGYDLQINGRIIIAIVFVALACMILFFFACGRPKKLTRIVAVFAVALSVWPLWKQIYSNHDLYYETYMKNYLWIAKDERDKFIATGFQYPFLHSISTSANAVPAGYDEKATVSLLEKYPNKRIPDDRKVNILVVQLESFCDLTEAGIPGVSPEVDRLFRELQEDSLSGTMIANVIGGGTITTERGVLTGNYKLLDYHHPAYSYVQYLIGQGFDCYSTHPNNGVFYARQTTNLDLGFEEHYSLDNYFQSITDGKIQCDSTYLPEVFRMFRERVSTLDNPVFAFNVTWQGHYPFTADTYTISGDYWQGSGISEEYANMLNTFFGCLHETQTILTDCVRELEDEVEPVVVLVYGDHKPWLGDEVYEEMGLSFSMETEADMIRYLGTPYLIWANQATKEKMGVSFQGKLPTVSPGYLMNVLFDQLGWDGPAYMQITDGIMVHLPVICTRGGYIEDGKYVQKPDEKGEELLKTYDSLQYYLRYRPELAKAG